MHNYVVVNFAVMAVALVQNLSTRIAGHICIMTYDV